MASFLWLTALFAVVAMSSVTLSDTITADYCNEENQDVYSGVVVGAKCNCIPNADMSRTGSALGCQEYRLEDGVLSVCPLDTGFCNLMENNHSLYEPSCGQLTMIIKGNIENSVCSESTASEGGEMPTGSNCTQDCPKGPQPCDYTVQVTESFKGNYTEDEMVNSTGPNLSCDINRRLVINTTYMVGIGYPCEEWLPLSNYTDAELDMLRNLRNGTISCTATSSPSPSTATTSPITSTATSSPTSSEILITPNVVLLGFALVTSIKSMFPYEE